MENIDFFLTGISVILAAFLLAVGIRAYRKSGMRMFLFILLVFLVILLDGVILIISGFGVFTLPISNTAVLMISDVIILLLFYYGVVRGS